MTEIFGNRSKYYDEHCLVILHVIHHLRRDGIRVLWKGVKTVLICAELLELVQI